MRQQWLCSSQHDILTVT